MPQTDLDPKSICRACAGPFIDKRFVNLMKENETRKIFVTFSTTEVDPSDTLPKSICLNCESRLKDYQRFQNTCIASYKFLLDCFPPKTKRKSLRPKRKRETTLKNNYTELSHSDTPDDGSDFEFQPHAKKNNVRGKKAIKSEQPAFAEVDIEPERLNSDDDDILAAIVRECKQEAEIERKKEEEKRKLLSLWVPGMGETSKEEIKSEPEDSDDMFKDDKGNSSKSKNNPCDMKYDPKKIKEVIQSIKIDVDDIKQDSEDVNKSAEDVKAKSQNIKKDSSEIKIDVDSDNSPGDFDSDDDERDKDFDVTKEEPANDDSDDDNLVIQEKPDKPRSRLIRIETFHCDKCPKVFIMKERYEGHLRTHQGLKAFECDQCDKKYARYERLKLHKKHEHSGQVERFNCEIEGCDKTFKNRETLKKHVRAHIDPEKYSYKNQKHERRVFICELCGQSLRSKTTLKEHEMMHRGEAPFKCDKCTKCFRTQRKLDIHKLRHDAVKKFPCEICGLKKISLKELKSHMNIHTRKRTHICPLCGAGFLANSNLSRHIQSVHDGVKKFVCPHCNKRFVKNITLRTHLRKKHSGDDPTASNENTQNTEDEDVKLHPCTLCSKEFKRIKSLRAHMLFHSGITPFSCPECNKGFTTRQSMLRHIRRHKEKAKEAAEETRNEELRAADVNDERLTSRSIIDNEALARERSLPSSQITDEEALARERLLASSRIAFDILNNLY